MNISNYYIPKYLKFTFSYCIYKYQEIIFTTLKLYCELIVNVANDKICYVVLRLICWMMLHTKIYLWNIGLNFHFLLQEVRLSLTFARIKYFLLKLKMILKFLQTNFYFVSSTFHVDISRKQKIKKIVFVSFVTQTSKYTIVIIKHDQIITS